MITGGEMADPADCQAAMQAAPRARLLNAYGLTETTITSALFDVSAGPEAPQPEALQLAIPVPAGKPVRHARIMVLGEKLEPVPAGTVGEIYVGGCGVARGYLGRPALTAELFLPDSGGAPGSVMYRTGDLGRWREDGNLEVTGRTDRQLKVRGSASSPVRSRACWPGTRASGRWPSWQPGRVPATRAWRPITRSPAARPLALTRAPRRQPRTCGASSAPACLAT